MINLFTHISNSLLSRTLFCGYYSLCFDNGGCCRIKTTLSININHYIMSIQSKNRYLHYRGICQQLSSRALANLFWKQEYTGNWPRERSGIVYRWIWQPRLLIYCNPFARENEYHFKEWPGMYWLYIFYIQHSNSTCWYSNSWFPFLQKYRISIQGLYRYGISRMPIFVLIISNQYLPWIHRYAVTSRLVVSASMFGHDCTYAQTERV